MVGLLTSTFNAMVGAGDGLVVVWGFPSAPCDVTVRGGGTAAPGILALDRIDPLPPCDTFRVTTLVIGAVTPESAMAMSKRILRGEVPAAVPTVARGSSRCAAGAGVAGAAGAAGAAFCAIDRCGAARAI